MARHNDGLQRVTEFTQMLLNYHTSDTRLHFKQVQMYTRLLCLQYNLLYPEKALSEDTFNYIMEGAKLHDVGKISVPDVVLRRKGALTGEEFDQIKKHTVIGSQIIDQMADIYHIGSERTILHNICRSHHERWDGSGYPDGLKGDEIPIEAQLVSVAEVYAALTENNYRESITHMEAVRQILNGDCGEFNPMMMECLRGAESALQDILSVQTKEERLFLIENMYTRNRRNYWVVKRTADVVLSGLMLLVLSPLMGIIALTIYIDDPKGSPIFKQVRLTRHKKEFTMYKFRTMCVDAEARKAELEALNEKKDGDPTFKIANDPRITRVGKLLRKTGLDELPQLVNILKGDMTFVGPRPPLPKEQQEYSRYDELRLSVTPGLTCIWQTQPNRDEIPFDDWMDMDVAYIGTRSIKSDVIIFIKTALSIFSRHGGH